MLEYIKQHPILKHTKLIAYGQSLGGSVAISLVSRNEDKFDALIIENTFLSVVINIYIDCVAYTTTDPHLAFISATRFSSLETSSIPSTPNLEIIQDNQIRTPCTHLISVEFKG